MNESKHRVRAPRCAKCTWSTIVVPLLLLAGCASSAPEAGKSIKTPSSGEAPADGQRAEPRESPASRPPGTPAPGGGPILTFAKQVHDFGEVGPYNKNTCEFRFRNTGTGVLQVNEKIESTCGCTVPVLAKTQYQPGEEGVVRVTYSASTATGPMIKNLVVQSNDKSNGGKATLTIRAKIVERVAVEPKQLDLVLSGPKAGCPPITLRSLDQRSFSVTRIISSGGAIAADFDPSFCATEMTFRPTVDVEKLQQYPTGSLLLALTHPECPEVRIAYQLLSAFELRPPSLMLFGVEPNRPIAKEVWLTNNYGREFEIAALQSREKILEVVEKEKVVSETGGNVRYRLKLSIKPPVPSGTQRAFADVLSIQLAGGQTLQLPCHGFYAGQGVPVSNLTIHRPQ